MLSFQKNRIHKIYPSVIKMVVDDQITNVVPVGKDEEIYFGNGITVQKMSYSPSFPYIFVGFDSEQWHCSCEMYALNEEVGI